MQSEGIYIGPFPFWSLNPYKLPPTYKSRSGGWIQEFISGANKDNEKTSEKNSPCLEEARPTEKKVLARGGPRGLALNYYTEWQAFGSVFKKIPGSRCC